MWKGDLPRTYPDEINERVGENQLVVAEENGLIVGTVSVQPAEEGSAGVFGMLAVDEKYTRRGIGAQLIEYAETWAISKGMREMRLELLKPSGWDHPAKQVLIQWYTTLGYHPVEEMSFYQRYPEPAAHLTTHCDFTLWVKKLKA